MEIEQIHIIADGRTEGKRYIDCSINPNRATDIAYLLSFILEHCTLDEMNKIIDVLHSVKPESKNIVVYIK